MPSLPYALVFALVAGASLVSAHGFVKQVKIGGTVYKGFDVNTTPYKPEAQKPKSIAWSDSATDLGFVASDQYGSGDIICHKNATNGAIAAEVAPGGIVQVQWNTWPDSHKGPVIDYLADCGADCTTVDKNSLKFFKIQEMGIIDASSTPGKFASDKLLADNLTWSITVPQDLQAGNYVLRHEMIALHAAGSPGGAQNYPQCMNLKVTGSGAKAPPEGILGTALYKINDAGIVVNINQKNLDYKIPGPPIDPALGSTPSKNSPSTESTPTAGNPAGNPLTATSSTTTSSSSSSSNTCSSNNNTTASSTNGVKPLAATRDCKRSHPRDVRRQVLKLAFL